MRANPYAVTNRSGGRSGWSGSALMVPGGISDGLAKLGQALVEAPLARRRIEQQAAVQKAQQDRQGRQDTLAEALGVSRMDESKARVSQMQDDSSRKWAEDAGRGALNALGVLGIGPNAKGVASQPRDDEDDDAMTMAQARALAIKQATAEAREGRGADPNRIDVLTDQFLGKTPSAPKTPAPKALGDALAGAPAVVPEGVEVPPAGTSSAGPASPPELSPELGNALGSALMGKMASQPQGAAASLASALSPRGAEQAEASPAAIMAPLAAAPAGLSQALNVGPTGPAPMPGAPAKTIAASKLPTIAANLHGGDVDAARAGLVGQGYVIDESR